MCKELPASHAILHCLTWVHNLREVAFKDECDGISFCITLHLAYNEKCVDAGRVGFWRDKMFVRILLSAGLLMVVAAFRSEQISESGRLRLTEVFYDTPGIDAAEEWVELANLGTDAIDLTEFKLGDEESRGGSEGMARFPDGATIGPGQAIVVAQTAIGFKALFGQMPDYELVGSDSSVPDMGRYALWASGDLALANDGDEVVLLDGSDHAVDALSYGDSRLFFSPAVADVLTGQSIERMPADCDSDTAADWLPQRLPTPGELSFSGDCRIPAITGAPDARLPIGQIQGSENVSPYINQIVSLRGVVTGFYEDRNSRGAIFHTMFVQDLPDERDDDPATSDGIAIFLGLQEPTLNIGDLVQVTGRVTEFFGLTEIDDDGLHIAVEGKSASVPGPISIDPPADNDEQTAYLEALEGMRVSIDGIARVVGPTHSGCGFAVIHQNAGLTHVHARTGADPVGQVVTVLHRTDVNCTRLPAVKSGDAVTGIAGPLTYNFDRFKIVQQDGDGLNVSEAPIKAPAGSRVLSDDEATIASFNLEDYFDTNDDTGSDSEPKPTSDEVNLKRAKLAYQIGIVLNCPTILGVQEVENRPLLIKLAEDVAGTCNFMYEVSHLESADARGIDVALLTDPRHVVIKQLQLRQGCSSTNTGITDPGAECPAGRSALFSRPPLQVDLQLDAVDFTFFVNHFKSKRGGAAATAARRMAQAEHINHLAADLLELDASARIVVLGDFNDYELAPPLLRMTSAGGQLLNPLLAIPRPQRYSYIFDGISQLIDGILISPALADEVIDVTIFHVNADYPYTLAQDPDPNALPFRASDHDPLLLILEASQEPAIAGAPTPATPGSAIPAAVPSMPTSPGQVEFGTVNEVSPQGTSPGISGWALAGLLIGCVSLLGLGVFLRRREA